MSAIVQKRERVVLRSDADVVVARRRVGEWAVEIGLTALERTKVVTAASELARNTLVHGQGGVMSLAKIRDGTRVGLCLCFEDQGPGIADIDQALEDGFSTGGGMGLGLSGARRLAHEFALTSTAGGGTCVTIVQWKP